MPRNKDNSFQYIMRKLERQETKALESERKLLEALNSCSIETRRNYANLLKR